MKRANIPNYLKLLEAYDKKSKRTKPMKDDFTVYNDHYVAVSIYNKQRQMIKEQKKNSKIIFPEAEIKWAENIVRIEIRCMESKVRELKKKFHLMNIEDFMISAKRIGDDLFKLIYNGYNKVQLWISHKIRKINMYSIKRNIEEIVKKRAKNNKAILLTGPRQVGKSTLFKHLFKNVNQVTFDDDLLLAQVEEDVGLFLLQTVDSQIKCIVYLR